MKSINAPTILDIPGFAVQECDPLRGVGNIFTALTSMIHRPATVKQLDMDQIGTWIDLSLQTAHHGEIERSQVLELIADEKKPFDPIQLFLGKYSAIIAGLVAHGRRVPDFSLFLRERMGQTPGWSREYVSSPELGFPHELLTLSNTLLPQSHVLGLPDEVSEDREPIADGGGWEKVTGVRRTVAWTTAVMDLCSLDIRIVPAATTLTSNQRNAREKPIGQAEVAIAQREILVALGLLWALQFDAYWLHMTSGTVKYLLSTAAKAMPNRTPLFEVAGKMVDEIIATIPLHPVWGTAAALYQPGTAQTLLGRQPTYFIPEGSAYLGDPKQLASEALAQQSMRRGVTSTLIRNTLVSCVSEVLHLGESTGADAVGLATTVVQGLLPDSARAQGAGIIRSRSVSKLLRFLRNFQRYTQHWPAITQQLGWKRAVVGTPVELETAGCCFALTDGDNTSVHPAHIMAGLVPCFAVSNRKLTGATERYSKDFNTGPDPRTDIAVNNGGQTATVSSVYSVLTAVGHLASSIGPQMLTRYWLPTGLHLGEEGGEIRYMSSVLLQYADQEGGYADRGPDPIGTTMMDMYLRLSPRGYIRAGVGEPKRLDSRVTAGEGAFYRTSWTTWTVHPESRDACQALLLGGYDTANLDQSKEMAAFLYRASGWKQRVVVAKARTDRIHIYDNLGFLIRVQPYRGEVLFDTDVNLGFSTTWTDAVIDLVTSTMDQSHSDTQEAKPPEQTHIVTTA